MVRNSYFICPLLRLGHAVGHPLGSRSSFQVVIEKLFHAYLEILLVFFLGQVVRLVRVRKEDDLLPVSPCRGEVLEPLVPVHGPVDRPLHNKERSSDFRYLVQRRLAFYQVVRGPRVFTGGGTLVPVPVLFLDTVSAVSSLFAFVEERAILS